MNIIFGALIIVLGNAVIFSVAFVLIRRYLVWQEGHDFEEKYFYMWSEQLKVKGMELDIRIKDEYRHASQRGPNQRGVDPLADFTRCRATVLTSEAA